MVSAFTTERTTLKTSSHCTCLFLCFPCIAREGCCQLNKQAFRFPAAKSNQTICHNCYDCVNCGLELLLVMEHHVMIKGISIILWFEKTRVIRIPFLLPTHYLFQQPRARRRIDCHTYIYIQFSFFHIKFTSIVALLHSLER